MERPDKTSANTSLQPSGRSAFKEPSPKGASAATSETSARPDTKNPLFLLTKSLLTTYTAVNMSYAREKRKRRPDSAQGSTKKAKKVTNGGYDNEKNDLIINIGDEYQGRYVVERLLGKGSFGQVVRALDVKENEHVAIKIIKNRQAFRRQAKMEIELLDLLNKEDPGDENCIVRYKSMFEHHGHYCLVFELLSHNLYDILRHTNHTGVSLGLVRKFGIQVLKALAKLHTMKIIHCDLKPENILLINSKRSAVKVIDFGSSCRENKTMYQYIQSRYYRSPEVLLGLPYGMPIDMWSLACVLVEMHTGEPLFNGTDEFDQMNRIVEMLGVPPAEMLRRGKKTKEYFKETASGYVPVKRKNGKSYVGPGKRTLEKVLNVGNNGPRGLRPHHEKDHSIESYNQFMSLIDSMLKYKPEDRISPMAAIQHEFFRPLVEQGHHSAPTEEQMRLYRSATSRSSSSDRVARAPSPVPRDAAFNVRTPSTSAMSAASASAMLAQQAAGPTVSASQQYPHHHHHHHHHHQHDASPQQHPGISYASLPVHCMASVQSATSMALGPVAVDQAQQATGLAGAAAMPPYGYSYPSGAGLPSAGYPMHSMMFPQLLPMPPGGQPPTVGANPVSSGTGMYGMSAYMPSGAGGIMLQSPGTLQQAVSMAGQPSFAYPANVGPALVAPSIQVHPPGAMHGAVPHHAGDAATSAMGQFHMLPTSMAGFYVPQANADMPPETQQSPAT